MSRPIITFVLCHENARAPVRGTPDAAGFDLYACEDCRITGPNEVGIVKTGVKVIIPAGHYGRIAERSGLAVRGLRVGGGVIDRDYRGNIGVIVSAIVPGPFEVKAGERIAQFILEAYSDAEVIIVSGAGSGASIASSKEHSINSIRGTGGFGSTGRHSAEIVAPVCRHAAPAPLLGPQKEFSPNQPRLTGSITGGYTFPGPSRDSNTGTSPFGSPTFGGALFGSLDAPPPVNAGCARTAEFTRDTEKKGVDWNTKYTQGKLHGKF